MRLNILRALIVVLASVSAAVIIAGARPQKTAAQRFAASLSTLGIAEPTQTPTPAASAQEPTVEQAQKNIKVLTGMPQSQLIPAMNFFAVSLGVRCNYCHVNQNGQWDYASDEKEEKQTARGMIKLVLDVNKNTFRGNPEVSCYTCHRGRTGPQSSPSLPLPAPTPRPSPVAGAATNGSQTTAGPRPTLPTADEIFNKYTAAIGGQAAIDKLKTRTAKGTITQANGNSFQFELNQAAPEKFYLLVTTQQGTFERGFNGTVGWEKTNRLREVTGSQLADLKATNTLFTLINLKSQFTRTRVSKDKLGDRDVYVVSGQTVDGRRMRLYFDIESGLLLRRSSSMPTMIGVIPDQVDLEDYRDVDGIKFPFTWRASTVEAGNPTSTRKFTEIKVNAQVDEAKFNMPPAPAKTTP
jgi:photosynthetic reaction center cytochrome c subunit